MRLGRVQGEFLHSPVGDLSYVELVGVAAIDLVHRAELLQQLAGPAELAEDLSVQLHLVDFTVFHVGGAVGVGTEEILMRPWGDANRPRGAHVEVLRFELSVVIEYLNAAIAAIAYVNVALRVGGDGVRGIELARRRAS